MERRQQRPFFAVVTVGLLIALFPAAPPLSPASPASARPAAAHAASHLASARPAITSADTGSAQFTPGLPLLDNAGATTGAAEPSIRVDREGHIYVTGPAGVPTGGCPLWRVHPDSQNAKGLPYEYLGKFDTDQNSAGGGDCDIATGGLTPTTPTGFDNLAVSSLSLANLTTNQSADGGATFHNPANSAGQQVFGDDRQWNAADSGIGQVYMTVHDLATNNIQVSSSTDGGYVYRSQQPAIDTTPGSCGQTLPDSCFTVATMDNHFGNIVVNPRTHQLYTIYVAPANGSENRAAQMNGAPPNEHVVYVAIGTPSCGLSACAPGTPITTIAWTDHIVYTAPSGDDLAHIFPVIGIDRAGTVYTAWSDSPSAGANAANRPANHIFMSHSTTTTPGDSWTTPVQVDQGTSHSNMFPWLVAGAAGQLDVVWYSAQLNGTNGAACPAGVAATEPADDASGVNNNCHDVWTTQFAQSANANTASPAFTQSQATDVMHRGSLCDQGLNCSLFGGDRTVLDYFQVDLDPAGAANIAYASDAGNPGTATINYTRQCTGLSATSGGTVSYSCASPIAPPPPPPADSCSGQNVVTDPSGDATNPLGLPGGTDQVDITNASFSSDPAHTVLTTTMTIANLSQTPIAGTADTYYYVAWTNPSNGQTYATEAAQPDPSGRFTYFYGPFDPSKNQIITPTATTGTASTGANGTISVLVPLSGVGNPTIPVDPSTNPNAQPAVAQPYALTISGEGVLGSGLVFTHPDDRAPNSGFGARYAVCPSGALPTALPTTAPTLVPTTAPGGGSTGGANGIAFAPANVVDDQREGAEPDVKICGPGNGWSYGACGLDNPYVSWPYGFSTTSSFLSRSEDQGKTFKLTPSNSTTGKPDACPGGGDTDLGVTPGMTQSQDYLNFVDLQGLTNFSSGVSTDGGQTFPVCNPATSNIAPVDRQWFGLYGNQAAAAAVPPTAQIVPGILPGTIISPSIYLDYDIVGAPSCTITGSVPGAETPAGNEFVVQRSTDGGRTFAPFSVADCNDGIAGNMQVNQTNGHVFAIHTAYANPAAANTTDVVTVNKSTDGGATWTKTVAFTPTVPSCKPDCVVGEDFAVLAIDKAGGLYAVWAQNPVDSSGAISGPGHIYYSYSPNEGATWTPEQQVDANGTTDVNLFAWVAAGAPGKIDVVWYGTNKASGVNTYDSGSQTSDWFPYLSQSLNANGGGAIFSAPIRVSQHPNHNGGICTMGIGCTTGGDRSLADFFQVDVNKQGGADVVWADTSNNSNTSGSGNQAALVDEARQVSGSTLFGTTLNGTSPTCLAVTTTPCQADQTGDAHYEANGTIGNNVPKLDITGSSVNVSATDPLSLDIRMNIADLSKGLPSAADTDINANDQVVDYLTSWNYHVPGHTQANFDSTGNIYYAYLEVNRATGAVTAYDGNTCGVPTTRDKILVYPGQNAITYSINRAAGTIDLYVPRADVGAPGAGESLYSVTAHTVGQPAAAGSANCATRDPNGNNPDPTGQIFDVYDKSPAYTAALLSNAPGVPMTATPTRGATVAPTSTSASGPTPAPTSTTQPMATATTGPVGGPATSTPTAPPLPPANTSTNTPVPPGATSTTQGGVAGPNATATATAATNAAATATAAANNTAAAAATAVANSTAAGSTVAANSTAAAGSTVAANSTAAAGATVAAAATATSVAGSAPPAGATMTSSVKGTRKGGNAPRITLNPGTVRPGGLVTVHGYNFGCRERITLALNAEATSTRPFVVTTACNGSFTATFAAPGSLLNGANTVGATGNHTGRSAVAALRGILGVAAQFFFAGGMETSGEHTTLALLNPNRARATVWLTFYTNSGRQLRATLSLRPNARGAFPVAKLARLSGSFGLALTADRQVAAQLDLTRQGQDGDSILGNTGLGQTWYLAEGYTGLTFHETVSVLNPGARAARVHLQLLPFGGRRGRAVTVNMAAHSHAVVDVNRLLPGASLSIVARSNQPVVVERALTFSRGGYGLTARSGTGVAASTWLFAEGTTTNRFQTFLTMLNPGDRPTGVTALFYGPTGRMLGKRAMVMAPRSRANILLNKVLRASGVASVVMSDQPIIVERPEYFGSPNATRIAGSDVFGRNGAGVRWSFPGGDTGRTSSEFLLLYNPSSAAVPVDVTLYNADGGTATRRIVVPARARYTLNVGKVFGSRFAGAHGATLQTVHSGQGIIVEQTVFAPNHSTLQSTQGLAQ